MSSCAKSWLFRTAIPILLFVAMYVTNAASSFADGIEQDSTGSCLGQIRDTSIARYVSAVRANHREKLPLTVILPTRGFQELVRCSRDHIAELVEVLRSKVADERVAAYLVLREISERSFGSIEVFETPDDSTDLAIRQWREWFTSSEHDDPVAALIEQLRSSDEGLRKSAIMRLGEVDDARVAPALRSLLCGERQKEYVMLISYALAERWDLAAVPGLVDWYLTGDSVNQRTGIRLLERLVGQTFGFGADASAAEKVVAIDRWRHWVMEEGVKLDACAPPQ